MPKHLYITIASITLLLSIAACSPTSKEKKLDETVTTQPPGVKKIDQTLTTAFKTFEKAELDLRYDSLGPALKKQMLKQLLNPLTFDYNLDSLAQYIFIKTSPDKKIKFYSWPNLEGGTWHTMQVMAQFKSTNGKIIVKSIVTSGYKDEDIDFTDSEIYEVNEFVNRNTTHYITFGAGSYGNGMKHKIVQIFKIQGDSLIKCTSCFENNMDLIVEYFRGAKLDLKFNPESNELTYNEVKSFEGKRFYGMPTNNTVTLKLEEGIFKGNDNLF